MVTIWVHEEYDKIVWNGIAFNIPYKYKNIPCVIFSDIPEDITNLDIINIKLLKESEE